MKGAIAEPLDRIIKTENKPNNKKIGINQYFLDFAKKITNSLMISSIYQYWSSKVEFALFFGIQYEEFFFRLNFKFKISLLITRIKKLAGTKKHKKIIDKINGFIILPNSKPNEYHKRLG